MSKKLAVEPGYIAIDLTYRCNASCHFCFLKNNPGLKKREAGLSFSEIAAFVDALGPKPRRFYLTGGEPLLRKDLPEIVRHIKSRGHRCLLTTNGTLLDPRSIHKLLSSEIDDIVISLHGSESVHDATLGFKGAFRRAVKSIRAIALSKSKTKTRLNIWCTINRLNHSNLESLCGMFLRLGADEVAFNHLEFMDRKSVSASAALWRRHLGHSFGVHSSQKLVEGIDVAVLSRQIRGIKARFKTGVKFYPDLSESMIERWYRPDSELRRSGKCYGQWESLWISPYGEILSCQPLAEKLGTIKGGKHAGDYAGPKYRRFRKLLEAYGGFFPACARCGRVPYQSPGIPELPA